jgi:predicted GNAT family acetyltransferase
VTGPTVSDAPERSRFEIHVDGRRAGFAAYRTKQDGSGQDGGGPGLLVFTHTEIDDAYGGRGLGSVLVRAALDSARSRGLPVRPDCPFVRAFVARHPDDYLDLVPADLRPRLGL